MTSPINNQKRIAPFDESSSKRLKDEAPLHPFISLLGLTNGLFSLSLSIQTIGTLSQVSKEVHQIALCLFLPKAQSLRLPAENAVTAKFWLKKLYPIAKKFHYKDHPSWTIEEKIERLIRQNRVSLFHTLSQWGVYHVKYTPLLDLYEDPKYWQSGEKTSLSQAVLSNGYQALTYATYAGRRELVNRLLEHQAPTDVHAHILHPMQERKFLPKPLHIAVLRGDLEMVKSILEKNPNLNVNFPPWHLHPIESPHLSLLECAIGGNKALEYHDRASLHQPMVQFLLDKGVRPVDRDLIAAAEVVSMETIDLLLKNGGVFTQEIAAKALYALIETSCNRNPSGPSNSEKTMAQFLLNKEADIHALKEPKVNPLHLAIKHKNIDWVEFCINHFTDRKVLEAPNRAGYRPLQYAVMMGNIPIIQYLLKAGADVNARADTSDEQENDLDCASALTCACFLTNGYGEPPPPDETTKCEIVQLLLSYGAEPYLSGQSQYSPLHRAVKNGFKEIVKILPVKPTDLDLITAAEKASMELMDLLLDKGGVFTRKIATEALYALIKTSCKSDPPGPSNSEKAMAQFLLDNEADIHALEEFAVPPLHLAIKHDNIDWVKFCIDHFTDLEALEAPNCIGYRPLQYAVMMGNIPIIQCLLEAGANVNALTSLPENDNDVDRASALTCACFIRDESGKRLLLDVSNRCEIVKLLLSNGAKPCLSGQNYCSPLSLAKKNGFDEIVQILEKHIAAE